ncbi:MAG: hypothetical protein JWP65_2989 [Ramlibacter sp.]|jgi:hypothetical protein|uniref:DUF3619 family protein n=1 Tax=Ramlibacter sp. TaxID=1917967 RepID=UPI002607FC22|nr:DUF3619 family protein [Ramlibacter sp.]MDB5752568.1 hypothetical protein [Ramlibacter sp.]
MTTTTTNPQRASSHADQFGRAVASRLAASTDDLPYEVRERLRAARVQALQLRKQAAATHTVPAILANGSSATATAGEESFSLWTRIGSVLPLLALLAGLVLLHSAQADHRANEIAEVDAAILTDDLPPAAYADPGFLQFLKQSGRE